MNINNSFEASKSHRQTKTNKKEREKNKRKGGGGKVVNP
jgi:hypothetical protein